MSDFAEFLLIAIVLYLWESTLWIPLRGVVLRRRWGGGAWRVIEPDRLVVMRDLGLIPMLPLPPDAGLAPCQTPPLLADSQGNVFMESSAGRLERLAVVAWDDVHGEQHHLRVGKAQTRICSARCIDVLGRAKRRGATPVEAVRKAWRLALSPGRAAREWRRWKLVSSPLRWMGPVLVLGFFVVLPWIYLHRGSMQTMAFALWLWCLMGLTAAHLWWLGKRVYPGARAALRMDAVLSLLVPFHAMRAAEIASAHAMGTTHPAAMLLSANDLANPWLCRFFRRILHPMPGVTEDAAYSSALHPLITKSLVRHGKSLDDFDGPPDRTDDPAAAAYCPRCHAIYLAHVEACPDCRNMALRKFT